MSSRQKSPTTRPMRGGTRRRQNSQRRRLRRAQNSSRTAAVTGGAACSSVVSDKLEALKNLIPTHANGERKPDQLFQETTDYIVLLKTQVLILQRLVDLYGSNQNAAV
ncbi:uncharacterized protein LOC131298094 [Rhododendron vialii]|uniref:uncharacterized protein LOC131298094 n=1 Tax=Rhododendron vialii TaxID=182163 RepID=UPI0026603A92|nr:uncharacterized protein LOC131298094 [Rhododendron vialii]